MDEVQHPRSWRIAAPALLGWNVLGGAIGGIAVVLPVVLASSGSASDVVPDSASLVVLVVLVAAMLGALGGLLGGATLVLARGRRPTTRTLVRGIVAGVAVCALVAVAALLVPILPDGIRPFALVVGLLIGVVMLGLAFRSSEVHWREEQPPHRDLHPGDAPVYATDPIRDLVDPSPHDSDDAEPPGR
ncbi:hypothetical protein [Agrococcus jejuensis]|nr:hypothetical protein [Agrococcus jejuensis]